MIRSSELLAVAAREIGYHEGVGKTNKFGRWYGLDCELWCMEFVQWCYAKAGAPLPYKTASCGALLDWYRKHQPDCITLTPVEGCIVIFDFPGGAATDHTGLFVSRTKASVTTIDGNTSGTNQSDGGWVQQKTRPLSFARPTYIIPRALCADEKEVDAVERFNSLAEISSAAPWAAPTVERLIEARALTGGVKRDLQERPADLDLSMDMLRMLVILDRAGAIRGGAT